MMLFFYDERMVARLFRNRYYELFVVYIHLVATCCGK